MPGREAGALEALMCRGRNVVWFTVMLELGNTSTSGLFKRPGLSDVNWGLLPGSAHVSLPSLSCPRPNPSCHWLRPSLCPWSSQGGCGRGTEGPGVAAASQAFPTRHLVQHLRPTGRGWRAEDAAACHWSHFLPSPRHPAAPSCLRKAPASGCSHWVGCRLTAPLRLGLGGGAVSGRSWCPSP